MSILDRILPPNIKKLESKGDVDVLIGALGHKNPEIRAQAVSALGRIGGNLAVPHLVKALDDSSTKVRINTIKALGNIQTEEAVDPLLAQLGDETRAIRSAVRHALAEWKSNPRVVSALADMHKTQASAWWAKISGDRKNCDICSAAIERADGKILETEEIVASQNYLEYALRMRKLVMPVGNRGIDTKVAGLDPYSQSLLDSVGRTVELSVLKSDLEKITTPWLVCDDCITNYFEGIIPQQ